MPEDQQPWPGARVIKIRNTHLLYDCIEGLYRSEDGSTWTVYDIRKTEAPVEVIVR